MDRGWLRGHTAHRVTKAFLLIPAHLRASPSADWPVRGATPGSAASLHERGQDLAGLTQPRGPNKHVWMSCSFGMRNTDMPRSLAGSQAALPGAGKITRGHQAEGHRRAPAWQEPPCLSCQLQGRAEPICVSETGREIGSLESPGEGRAGQGVRAPQGQHPQHKHCQAPLTPLWCGALAIHSAQPGAA